MKVRDPQRITLLMRGHGLSTRQLAEAAGWSSHSYLTRILRGEVRTLRPAPAVAIAERLGVPVEHLFDVRVTAINGQSDQRRAS